MGKRGLILAAVLILSLTACQKSSDEPTLVESGMTAIDDGQYDDALTIFEKAITLEEDLIPAYRGRGLSYMGNGDYADAVKSFDQALLLVSDKMQDIRKDILFYKASALYKQDDYIGTISVCDDILRIAEEGDAYYLRGTCYLENGEDEKAKENFDAAVSLQPKDYDLYLNIYESYREKKRSADGDVYLQTALNIKSEDEESAYQRARIYYYLENYRQAKDELQAMVEDKQAEALLLMGKIYMAMEDAAHSRNMYEQYMTVHGETPEAYNGIVLADIAEEEYDAALEQIQKGLALDAEEGKQELYFNEIVVYERQHKFDAAKEKAMQYQALYPQDEAGQREYEFLQTR